MEHPTTQARKRLTLPLPLRAKMTGLAMFIGGFMGLITSAQLDPISAHVERVIDGDTIQVRVEGKRHTVRLIGVDTPETKHPTRAVQYFGREASAFTKAALAGKTVLLNGLLKVDFQGSHVTSDGGLILVRELDERLGLGELIDEHLSDSRQGTNKQFTLADLLR